MNHLPRPGLIALAAASLVLAGCCVPWPAQVATGTPACPAHEIAFTQATGCLNDGSFEFCIPAGSPDALQAVRALAPRVTCVPSAGRAGCNTRSELLCLVETRGLCQPEHPAALTGQGWQTVCALAALPFVRAVVPTWYE